MGGLDDTFESIDIICNADSSCIASSITIDHFEDVDIICISGQSCAEMEINITNSIAETIICHELCRSISKYVSWSEMLFCFVHSYASLVQ